MQYRTLGRTGAKVSLIGVGGYHIGQPKDPRDGIAIIRSAIDNGVTFMDNSWDYHLGDSEIRMGNALRDGYRDKVFLMTKVDGRTRWTVDWQLDESLKRLQTDHVDLLQIHEVIRDNDPDRVFGKDGAIEALLAAKKAGKIRFFGFSGHKTPAMLLKMIRLADQYGVTFDTVQMPLNVMDAHYDSFQQNVLPVALEKNMGVIAMKCFGDNFILQSKTVTPLRGAALHDEPADQYAGRRMRMDRVSAAGARRSADISAAERDRGGGYPREDGRGCERRPVRILQDARHVRRHVKESEVARLKRIVSDYSRAAEMISE